jgi:hypothetical protein
MMNLSRMMDDCLARMAAGESIGACLARYPQRAAELTPLLVTAAQLHGLSDARLSQGQRLRAKVALREALAERNQPPASPVRRWRHVLPVALVLAAVLFASVTGAAIAGSRPGDFTYPLRIVVERAPILVRFSSAGRAAEEVDIAGRRLSDVREYLIRGGAVQPIALNELLARDEAALRRAEQLSAEEQLAIWEAVSGHAEELTALAGVALEEDAQTRLQAAADYIRDLSARLIQGPIQGATPQPQPATATPTRTASPVSAAAMVTPTETPVPAQSAAQTRTAAPTRTAVPTHTAAPTQAPPDPTAAASPTALPTLAQIAAPTAGAAPTCEPIVVPSATPLPPAEGEPTATPRPTHIHTIGPKLTLKATALPPGKQPTAAVPTIVMPTVMPTIQVPTAVLPTRPVQVTVVPTVTSSVSGLMTPTAIVETPVVTVTATTEVSTRSVPELTPPPLETVAAKTRVPQPTFVGQPTRVSAELPPMPGAALTAIAKGRPGSAGTPQPRRDRP